MTTRYVLAIGDTGNGKSYTARIFGAQEAVVGHGPASQTQEVKCHKCENGRYIYIDTTGFDDSDPTSTDQNNARAILMSMKDNTPPITEVHTILWFVNGKDRTTAALQRQAGFIRDLARYNAGDVWRNVIIVIKGLEVDDQTVTAIMEAASRTPQTTSTNTVLPQTGVLKVWLFDRLGEGSPLRRLPDDTLNEAGIYKAHQLLPKYEKLMQTHGQYPITILFHNATCLKCGEVTDPRLASPKCHADLAKMHMPDYKVGIIAIHRPPVSTSKSPARTTLVTRYGTIPAAVTPRTKERSNELTTKVAGDTAKMATLTTIVASKTNTVLVDGTVATTRINIRRDASMPAVSRTTADASTVTPAVVTRRLASRSITVAVRTSGPLAAFTPVATKMMAAAR
ncbi:hypothetical protein BC938DRAFT_476446 [Jimgerdemannia flammicorona]|uniref:G domain-containing protein n=1 Tax=Jimgerdemannia flammicorona TaxID=994334 RepID=A0A433QQG0_9FUNG|nr:hypothetical protein BC938DRAFT_476446 [Jimgerdemannia flammicorona]